MAEARTLAWLIATLVGLIAWTLHRIRTRRAGSPSADPFPRVMRDARAVVNDATQQAARSRAVACALPV